MLGAMRRWNVWEEPVDLVAEYFSFLSPARKHRIIRLESEIETNRWFPLQRTLGVTLRTAFPVHMGQKRKTVHGDCHCQNILLGRDSTPVFIDFATAGPSHYLKDLVTLEIDLLARGPDFVVGVSVPAVPSWLESIEAPDTVREHVVLRNIETLVRLIRAHAIDVLGATLKEYQFCCLLQALNMLSHSMTKSQHQRLSDIVKYYLRCRAQDRVLSVSPR
jgi:hypothetical protein